MSTLVKIAKQEFGTPDNTQYLYIDYQLDLDSNSAALSADESIDPGLYKLITIKGYQVVTGSPGGGSFQVAAKQHTQLGATGTATVTSVNGLFFPPIDLITLPVPQQTPNAMIPLIQDAEMMALPIDTLSVQAVTLTGYSAGVDERDVRIRAIFQKLGRVSTYSPV